MVRDVRMGLFKKTYEATRVDRNAAEKKKRPSYAYAAKSPDVKGIKGFVANDYGPCLKNSNCLLLNTLLRDLGFPGYIRDGDVRVRIQAGAGVSGIAIEFLPGVTKKFLRALRSGIMQTEQVIPRLQGVPENPPSNTKMIVKFNLLVVQSMSRTAAKEYAMETTAMQRLGGAPPAVIGGVVFEPTKVVPVLYDARYITMYGTHVLCMSRASGKTLNTFKKTLTAYDVAALEKATLTMWLGGVAHSDYHFGNILLDRSSRTNPIITIIDFGRAVLLSESVKKKVAKEIERVGNSPHTLTSPSLLQSIADRAGVSKAIKESYERRKMYRTYHHNADTVHKLGILSGMNCSMNELASVRQTTWVPKKCTRGYVLNDCIPGKKTGKPSFRCVKETSVLGKKLLALHEKLGD